MKSCSLRVNKYNNGLHVEFESRAPEKAQQLREYTALEEDLNLVFSVHIRWFTTSCDSSSKGMQYFWNPWVSTLMGIHIIKNNIFKKIEHGFNLNLPHLVKIF